MHVQNDKNPQPLASAILESLSEPAKGYIQFLETQLANQQAVIEQLMAQVRELEARLAKNSTNSNKPPGSDGLKKPELKTKSQRKNSGKKPGGQSGHVGKTLEQVDTPDHVIKHPPENCTRCRHSLDQVEGASIGVKCLICQSQGLKLQNTASRPCCINALTGIHAN